MYVLVNVTWKLFGLSLYATLDSVFKHENVSAVWTYCTWLCVLRHWLPKLRWAASCILFAYYCYMLKLSCCLFRIYVICYPLPSLIEGSHSDIFRVHLWVGSSASQTAEGIFRVRGPGKILCSAPAWGRDPWAQLCRVKSFRSLRNSSYVTW